MQRPRPPFRTLKLHECSRFLGLSAPLLVSEFYSTRMIWLSLTMMLALPFGRLVFGTSFRWRNWGLSDTFSGLEITQGSYGILSVKVQLIFWLKLLTLILGLNTLLSSKMCKCYQLASLIPTLLVIDSWWVCLSYSTSLDLKLLMQNNGDNQFVIAPHSVHYSALLRILWYLCWIAIGSLFLLSTSHMEIRAFIILIGMVILLLASSTQVCSCSLAINWFPGATRRWS